MNVPRQCFLTVSECDRVTDWMQCVWPVSGEDRALNSRLCEIIETAGTRRRERLSVPPALDLEMPLSVFGLPTRERMLLELVPIHTLGDLLRITEPELLAVPQVTPGDLQTIGEQLERHGLKLGMLASSVAALEPVEARRLIGWFRQVDSSWRDREDVQLAGRIAVFLGHSLEDVLEELTVDSLVEAITDAADAAEAAALDGDAIVEGANAKAAEPDTADDADAGDRDGVAGDDDEDDDDIVTFSIEDLELHDASDDDDDIDIDLDELDELDDLDDELDEDDLDLDEDDDDDEPDIDIELDIDAEPLDGNRPPPGSSGISEEPESPDEPWRSAPDWSPDDPDAWKGDTDDDADFWKPDSDGGPD